MTNGQRLAAELAALLLFGCALWGRAAPPRPAIPEVLRARRFEVVGRDGKVRARIGFGPLDAPRVELLDPKGNTRAALLLNPDNSSEARLFTERGRQAATLTARERSTSLWFSGPSSRRGGGQAHRSARVGVDADGEAGLEVTDWRLSGHVGGGTRRATLGVSRDGSSCLEVATPGGGLLTAEAPSGSAPRVQGFAYGKGKEPVWQVPAGAGQ